MLKSLLRKVVFELIAEYRRQPCRDTWQENFSIPQVEKESPESTSSLLKSLSPIARELVEDYLRLRKQMKNERSVLKYHRQRSQELHRLLTQQYSMDLKSFVQLYDLDQNL